MRDVAIIGVGMIKFGRYPEKTCRSWRAQAALLALKDAGVDMKDIELVASGNLYQSNAMVGQRILQIIGQTGIPVINVANACATGSTAFREAYMSVASGAYDMAMAVGSEQMGKMGLLGGGGGRRRPGVQHRGRARLGPDAGGLRHGGRRAHAQVRHHAGAVREGVREEPQALDAQPVLAVPDRGRRSRTC